MARKSDEYEKTSMETAGSSGGGGGSWLSSLDPTSSSSLVRRGLRAVDPSRAGGIANWMTFGGAHVFGLDDWLNDKQANMGLGGTSDAERARREAEEKAKTAEDLAAERRAYYDEVGREYQGIPGDPATQARADALYGQREPAITAGEMDASRTIAGGYSRRGLSGSGYATGSQSQAIQAAAAERSRARASALDTAVAEGRSGVLGKANISHMGDPFLSQQYATAAAELAAARAREQQQEGQFFDFLAGLGGRAVGAAVGGPAGAAVGGAAANGVTAPPYYLQDPSLYPSAPSDYYDPRFSFLNGY